MHRDESLYITNLHQHFETVKKMNDVTFCVFTCHFYVVKLAFRSILNYESSSVAGGRILNALMALYRSVVMDSVLHNLPSCMNALYEVFQYFIFPIITDRMPLPKVSIIDHKHASDINYRSRLSMQ